MYEKLAKKIISVAKAKNLNLGLSLLYEVARRSLSFAAKVTYATIRGKKERTILGLGANIS